MILDLGGTSPLPTSYTIGADRLTLLRDGAEAFPSMLEAIREARSTICLETYILRDDQAGTLFADALCASAVRGVEVNLLYDAWGSSISSTFARRLCRAGVRLVAIHPFGFNGSFAELISRQWRRDHRKILAVDGRVGYTGGLNISDDYSSPRAGGRGWRDTHLRIEGPSAAALEHLFLRTFRRNGGPPVDATRYADSGDSGGTQVRIVGSNWTGRREVRRAYLSAFGAAAQRILVTNAYFLPPLRTRRSLVRAARRGVDVQLIVAGTTDVPAVRYAARALYGRLLRAGIRIFEWYGSVLHAKTAVVDGHWSTVGSSNLDALSLLVNLEVNAVIEDQPFATALEAMFHTDLAACTEITLADWRSRSLAERATSWFAFLFRRWL